MQNNPGPNDPTYTPQPYPPYPGQPLYPPPGPPPKKRRIWLWIVLSVFALAVLGCVGILAASQGAKTGITPVATEGNTQAANTPAATQAPAANTIGKPVVVNDTWTVTLNSVKKSSGSEFDKPKTGNIFLEVNVTLHNTSSTTQHASSIIQWSLKDDTGQTYNEDITYGSEPGGTVKAGRLLRGSIAYEVPKSVHSFTLQFVADIGSTDLAEWQVKI